MYVASTDSPRLPKTCITKSDSHELLRVMKRLPLAWLGVESQPTVRRNISSGSNSRAKYQHESR
jgi:hypothetical protein